MSQIDFVSLHFEQTWTNLLLKFENGQPFIEWHQLLQTNEFTNSQSTKPTFYFIAKLSQELMPST